MRRLQIPPSRFKPTDWRGHVWLFFRDVAWGTLTGLLYFFAALYKLLGSWWIEPWIDHRNRKLFEKEVRETMPFLFQIYGGTIVPSPRAKAESNQESVAYVRADTLLFRFSSWHDETLEPLVANAESPRDMYNLNELLAALEPHENGLAAKGDKNLKNYEEILKVRFKQLSEALSDSQINETRRKLEDRRSRKY